MICKNCNTDNVNNEKFCKNCGTILELPPQTSTTTVNAAQQNSQAVASSNSASPEYVKNALNPDRKVYAIFSIIVPSLSIIWFISHNVNIISAILIAALSLFLAKKGKETNKKLALAGSILTYIFIGMFLLMLIVTFLKIYVNGKYK